MVERIKFVEAVLTVIVAGVAMVKAVIKLITHFVKKKKTATATA